MKKRILVRGPALSRSGYGEQTRFALRSLRAHEDYFDIYVIPVGWGKTGWIWEDNEERNWLDSLIKKTIIHQQKKGQYDISLQVTIPNEWEKLAPINIGYTAGVETTKVSPQFIEKSYLMDHIILVSNFAKEIYENTSYEATNNETGQVIRDFKCQTPMIAVNYCVRKFEGEPLDLDLDYDFNFFASAQWGPRKNLENMVKWFVEEFIDQKVGLVLKANWHNDSIHDRHHTEERLQQLLSAYPDRKCKVHLLHGSLTEADMHALYRHPKIKVAISATHGEGFGLPLFEAAYNGLPVIAPDWSGHCDFLFMPVKDKKTGKEKNKAMFGTVAYDMAPIQKEAVWDGVLQADSMWCFPQQGSFKMRLREVKKDYGRFKKQATQLQKYILENFTEEAKYEEFAIAANNDQPLSVMQPVPINGVSFCITTNGAKVEKTQTIIKAIKNQITTKKVEIVLVGDIEKFGHIEDVKMIDAADVANNRYLAELRNIAATNSTQDIIVYMDDDILLPPNWLWQLEEYSEVMGWDVISNRILNPDGTRLWDRALINPHKLVPYSHSGKDKNLYQTGGFSVHRRKVFERVKWDGTIPMYNDLKGGVGEDIDYSNRLHEAGFSLDFDKNNTAWHWDDDYTEINTGTHSLTLRKEDIIKTNPGQDIHFPPPCEEFNSLTSMLGV